VFYWLIYLWIVRATTYTLLTLLVLFFTGEMFPDLTREQKKRVKAMLGFSLLLENVLKMDFDIIVIDVAL
jgi:predicted membrane protein